MKKIILLLTIASILISCDGKQSTDDLIKSKDIAKIKEQRDLLQIDITKIDEALSKLEVKKDIVSLVSVQTIKDTVFSHYLEVQGNVDTKQNILIQPEMPGSLVSLNVKAGQRVSKGQVLGKTDDAGMGQQLASMENQYQLAKTSFERQKNLWNQKIGSEMQYLQAQTQMVSTQKGVLQMKAQLSKTLIRAPFSGVIDEVFVARGQVVAPSPQGLMRIVNLSDMYVSTSIPETYIGKLKIGAKVGVFLSSLNKTYNGTVRQIGSNINATNRSFDIEIAVPNPDNLLRPNQVAQLKIMDYSAKDVVVIPSNIIQQDSQNNKYVYVVSNANAKGGIAKKTIITVGKASGTGTEVLSGLSPADVIVTEGFNTLQEGSKLNF